MHRSMMALAAILILAGLSGCADEYSYGYDNGYGYYGGGTYRGYGNRSYRDRYYGRDYRDRRDRDRAYDGDDYNNR
jgi:hypothetical protein